MGVLIDIISWGCILVGCVLMLGGAVGLVRMPDLYTRLHAASLTDTGAVLFIVVGLSLQALFVFDNVMAVIKLSLILFFTLFTSPTASHALAKTALLGGLIPTDKSGRQLFTAEEMASQYQDSSEAKPNKHDEANDR